MGRWNNLKENMPVGYSLNFMLEVERYKCKFMLLRNLFRKFSVFGSVRKHVVVYFYWVCVYMIA
jgi:hypothetical protein